MRHNDNKLAKILNPNDRINENKEVKFYKYEDSNNYLIKIDSSKANKEKIYLVKNKIFNKKNRK